MSGELVEERFRVTYSMFYRESEQGKKDFMSYFSNSSFDS